MALPAVPPAEIAQALAAWMERNGSGSLAQGTRQLSAHYRAGEASSHVSLPAYVATRVPATYAATGRAMAEVAHVCPQFAPRQVLDIGTGPGTATWAALVQWPSLQHLQQVEPEPRLAALAQEINTASGMPLLAGSQIVSADLARLPASVDAADLVLAAYVLAELPVQQMVDAARSLWRLTKGVLLITEPGTPQGFARIREVRRVLLAEGAAVLAPCTHANACPMHGEDWCHFKVRVQRSRAHMHAKGAVVPFEDEALSYIALARPEVAEAVQHSKARIIGAPVAGKAGVTLPVCHAAGTAALHIARREKAQYKRAKHARWGDAWNT